MFASAPDATSALVTSAGMLAGLLVLSSLLDVRKAFDRLLLGGVTAAVLASYAIWRWRDTVPALEMSVESIWPHLFFGLELVAIVFTLFSIVILLRHVDRTAEADHHQRVLEESGAWPRVDIFICTYNEPAEVLEKSIVAALAVDYSGATVWVLDDTRRDWLRRFCEDLGARYITRPNNKGAKAGNLNNALAHTKALSNAPVILVLDADFIVQPNILRRTVGLLSKPDVALVQTPQHYYNADPIQHNLTIAHSWIDDQRFFFDVFQPAKDAWGCAFCVGTSFIVRRDRLEEIGGFPQGAISEDINLTYQLLARGYKTNWLNERLSVGLSAEGLPEYITQRARWCLGTIQVALLPDGPFRGKGFTLTQKWHYAHGILNWLSKPFLIALLIAPVLYWFAGVPAFHADYAAFLQQGVPALLCLWIYNHWISRARTLPLFAEVTDAVGAFAVTATLASAIVSPFGKPFKVTEKGGDRSQPITRWKLAALFGLISAASAAGIIWSFTSPYALTELTARDIFNLVWAAIAMLISFGAFLVCFERPRQDDLFTVNESSFAVASAGVRPCTLQSLSLQSAVLRSTTPWRVVPNEPMTPYIDAVGWVSGAVSARDGNSVVIQLRPTKEERRRLILRLFTSGICTVAVTAAGRGAFAGLVRRAFKPDK